MNNNILIRRMKDERWNAALLAKEIGISPQAMRNKLNGRNDFKAREITKLARILNLTDQEIIDIFLA